MKMMTKPVKPQLRHFEDATKIIIRLTSYEISGPLSSFTNTVEEYLIKFPGCFLELTLDDEACFYESDTPKPVLIISQNITAEDQFQEALKRYEQKLAKYEEWYNLNKAKADQVIAKKELVEVKKKAKEIERLKKQLEKLVNE